MTSRQEDSKIIKEKLAKIIGGEELEDYLRPEYYELLKESFDIIDINYGVTAVGILGKALENQVKEYLKIKLPRTKVGFQINSHGLSISKIREKLEKTTHANRLALLNNQLINLKGKQLKLKNKILSDKDYNELIFISRARNDSFHGCDEERYNEIDAESFVYLIRGASFMVRLEKEMVHNQ